MLINVGDVKLFFDIEGSKLVPDGSTMRERPTLLCLHGGPGLDHTGLRSVLSPLAAVAQLVYLDQRGHGRSDRSEPSRWSLAQWADDIAAFCEALSITKPMVLGVSFGGYVAMAYATRHVAHLHKLILISTSARGTANAIRRNHVLRAFEQRGGTNAREAARRALDDRTLEAYEEFCRVCGPFYNHHAADPAVLARTIRNPDVMPYFERPGGEGAVFDLTEELASVRCQTLVLAGEDDPITPVEEQEHIVKSMLPGLARLARFPNCGHGISRDDPHGVVEAIKDFLEEP